MDYPTFIFLLQESISGRLVEGEDATSRIKEYFRSSLESSRDVLMFFNQTFSDPIITEQIKIGTLSLFNQLVSSSETRTIWTNQFFFEIIHAIKGSLLNLLLFPSDILRNMASKVITRIALTEKQLYCLEPIGKIIENSDQINEIVASVYLFTDVLAADLYQKAGKNSLPEQMMVCLHRVAQELPKLLEFDNAQELILIYLNFIQTLAEKFPKRLYNVDICQEIMDSLIQIFPSLDFKPYHRAHWVVLYIVDSIYQNPDELTDLMGNILYTVTQGFTCADPAFKCVSIDFFNQVYELEQKSNPHHHQYFEENSTHIFDELNTQIPEINLETPIDQTGREEFERYFIKLLRNLFINHGNDILNTYGNIVLENLAAESPLQKYQALCIIQAFFLSNDNKYSPVLIPFIMQNKELLFSCLQVREVHVVKRILSVLTAIFESYPSFLKDNELIQQLVWQGIAELIQSEPNDVIAKKICTCLLKFIPIVSNTDTYFENYVHIVNSIIQIPALKESELIGSPFQLLSEVIEHCSVERHFRFIVNYIGELIPSVDANLSDGLANDGNTYQIIAVSGKINLIITFACIYKKYSDNLVNSFGGIIGDMFNPFVPRWFKAVKGKSIFADDLLDLIKVVLEILPGIAVSYPEQIYETLKSVITTSGPTTQGKAALVLSTFSKIEGVRISEDYTDALLYMIQLLQSGEEVFTKMFFADTLYAVARIINSQNIHEMDNDSVMGPYRDLLINILNTRADLSDSEVRNEVIYLYTKIALSLNELAKVMSRFNDEYLEDFYRFIFKSFIKRIILDKMEDLKLYNCVLELLFTMIRSDEKVVKKLNQLFNGDNVNKLIEYIHESTRKRPSNNFLTKLANRADEYKKRAPEL